MEKVRISVAVATYNGEKYIREQIESILDNLSPCDEIIVSDDGSTDATLDILKEYEGQEIPLQIIQGPGKGIKQNINEALKCCHGQYIFMADQDDVWTKDKVQTVMQYLGKNGCKLVNHDAQVMNAALTEVRMPSFFAYRGSKPGFWQNLWKNRYMGCCMAFDSSLLPYVLPIPDKIEMHDQWIGIINDLRGGNSRFIEDKLLLYRRHDTNVSDFTHGTFGEMVGKRWRLIKALVKHYLHLKKTPKL